MSQDLFPTLQAQVLETPRILGLHQPGSISQASGLTLTSIILEVELLDLRTQALVIAWVGTPKLLAQPELLEPEYTAIMTMPCNLA